MDADIFDLAPVSLWLQDYGGLLPLFAAWRAAGVESLAEFFAEDYSRIAECVARVRVVRVNRYTVDLYRASRAEDLLGSLAHMACHCDLPGIGGLFVQLWEGRGGFVHQLVNRSATGRLMNVVLTGTVLPGHEHTLGEVLVAVQDLTMQEATRRDLAESERYARGLFDHSPISLWVENFSVIKRVLDEMRGRGVTDLRRVIAADEGFAHRCLEAIRIVDVNDYTLKLFQAPDRETLLSRLPDILRDKVVDTFKDELVDLWEGKLQQEREITSYALGGAELHLHMQLSVFPGHENDWSLVLVALTDISARKRAEASLDYLRTHDVLTELLNRAFYVEEIERLRIRPQTPVSVIVIDLNGLKRVNDLQGHMVGDEMLRRLGRVLEGAVRPPGRACRIGGDEFAILLPRTDMAVAQSLLGEVRAALLAENRLHPDAPLEIAAGVATVEEGERLEDAIRLADQRMYDEKARFYEARGTQPRHRH
jgi:diguanylate cyclase (GGDEF)-like protein